MKEDTQDKQATMKALFGAGAHYGYTTRRRHPSMKPYIFGAKDKVQLIDLEKTIEALDVARTYFEKLGKEGKQVLFVGSKAEAKGSMKNAAEALEQPWVTERWIGGTLTNFPQIKKRVDRLKEIESERDKGEFAVYTKKEQLLIDRELNKLELYFGGLRSLTNNVGALFVIDPQYESIAVAEAVRMKIPIASVLNVDCDAGKIDYPVPANDGSQATISYLVDQMTQAYKAGKSERAEKKETPVQSK